MSTSPQQPRVAAVSYLNTVPLVWGLLHGSQRDACRLHFSLPAKCAEEVQAGEADIGLLPVIEMARQSLDFCPGAGIACDGPVRSILLVTKVPPGEIRTMAVDNGSRTSVMLARIILKRRYGVSPATVAAQPRLEAMLHEHDAALLIGDAALRVDPEQIPYLTLDLGQEWKQLTGLPMVFAVWCGKPEFITAAIAEVFRTSLAEGEQQMEKIVATESERRGFAPEVVRRYLTRHIRFHLGENEYEGLRMYLRFAAELEPDLPAPTATLFPEATV